MWSGPPLARRRCFLPTLVTKRNGKTIFLQTCLQAGNYPKRHNMGKANGGSHRAQRLNTERKAAPRPAIGARRSGSPVVLSPSLSLPLRLSPFLRKLNWYYCDTVTVLLANQRRGICMSWIRAKILSFLPIHLLHHTRTMWNRSIRTFCSPKPTDRAFIATIEQRKLMKKRCKDTLKSNIVWQHFLSFIKRTFSNNKQHKLKIGERITFSTQLRHW